MRLALLLLALACGGCGPRAESFFDPWGASETHRIERKVDSLRAEVRALRTENIAMRVDTLWLPRVKL